MFTLYLINDISNDLQKLLKYFNGAAIFTPIFLPLFGMVPIKFDLYLKDDQLSVPILEIFPLFSFTCSSLLNCHKPPEVSEYLSLYSIKLYLGIAILICSALSAKVSFISALDFLNSAQFLNAAFVSLFPEIIFPVTKIYASE